MSILGASAAAGTTGMNNLSLNSLSDKESNCNWRETETPLRKKWEYVLEHGLYADITFHIGKSATQIPCHSLVLKLQSKTFAEKCDTDFKYELDWIEPKPFKLFLKYLYTETSSFGAEDAISILFIAKKFDIQKLISICNEKVKREIGVHNAAFFYQHAHDNDDDALEQFAKDFILK